uniref:hypothetical chloroplast RF19 n=1 Tax=Melocactus glaucescens TaxID=2775423 RepID=UPI00286C2D38|nr:hypothetical chloroplast RF19 [Melocactus glaucescens]WKK45485.1 hypothetical chloroplast RF19 [Melocactus glaucescens]
MIFQSFPLGSIASLSMRIINSVVVVGLYYGFLTTFSIGPSYLVLFQAHIKVIEEGEDEIDKEVAAATGLITGQLVMFMSIYYMPLHLALGRPHTITFLVLFYYVLLFYWYNEEDFYGKRKRKSIRKSLIPNPSIQSIYLINLIYQLLNHFFFPSSMLARLVNIYMFRYNNKMLFIASSFVGWLIGHILFIKWVKFVLVWIQKNYFVRANRFILSNKYLFYVFGFYRDFIFEFRKYMRQFSAILAFFICLCTFGKMPSPFLTYRIKQEIGGKKKVEVTNTFEEEKEEETEPPLLKLFKEACYKIKNKNVNIPTSFSGNPDISKLEILREDNCKWLDQPPLTLLLFDYHRWNRPLRYIKNQRTEHAIRNEMSQFYFSTCKNDGKQRISFSHPPSLAIFREMIQRKISFSTTEKFLHDELYNDWIYAIEQKKKSLINEFHNRIAVLDKKGLKNINVFETKIRLCDYTFLKKKKEYLYLPKRYDLFLNVSYRGLIKKLFLPSIRILNERAKAIKKIRRFTVILNGKEIPEKENERFLFFFTKKNQIKNRIWINKIQSFLVNDYDYYESEQKIDGVDKESLSAEFEYFMSFIKDSLTQPIPVKNSVGIQEIRKKVPRWTYKLVSELEKLRKEVDDAVEHREDIREIPARRIILFKTKDEEGKQGPRMVLKRYTPGPQLRDLIRGSMRAQKRKSGACSMWQSYTHSKFYLSRTDSFSNFLIRFWYYIKGIFLKYMRKISEFEFSAYYYPSFGDLFITIEEAGEQEDDGRIRKNEMDVHIRRAELRWANLICGHLIRGYLLLIQSFIRKQIILPLLIIAKNIVRGLLLQYPEFSEDFAELKKEIHFLCTYNGVPFSERELPETWSEEGMQIKVVYPFRLKPWHRSRPSRRDRENSFYLTTWGLPTDTPYGIPEYPEISSFLKPIKKELYRKFKKFLKMRAIIFFKKLIIKELKKRLSKNVNQNLEFELKEKSSEIIKETDSIINNQMIHESSIEAQNLTYYSLIQKRMQNLANRISKIRNKKDELPKIFNISISPKKTHSGVLESLRNIVITLKNRTNRLIGKSGYFFRFLMEKIYVDLFLYIFNISRIYTQKFVLDSTKKILDKSIYNDETNQERVDRTNKNPIQFILTIKNSHFLFSSLLNSKINNNLISHSDLSFLSQAYVFYKLSQAQLINLYKLRSVFQYHGTSLFLKNEIKDYFGRIIHSELRTNKLPNSGMNQWKNWLKSNYQYGLSHRKWSQLVPKKWRKKIKKYFNKKKRNSYEKEQLINSNYQARLLPNEKENLKKSYKYEVLSYQFLDKKEFSNTNNYNIHKRIDMWWSIPIINSFNIMDIEQNTDRKHFDWKIIHFNLRKKGRIGAWIHSSLNNTKIEPKNYQIFDEFDIDDEIIDEKEKEIDKKEKKAFFDDKKDILCKKFDQTINRSHQKKNLFDWMGMNEEIRSRPVWTESWFFPEFVSLYYAYKMKPWTIPTNLLFSNFEKIKKTKAEDSKKKTKEEKAREEKKKKAREEKKKKAREEKKKAKEEKKKAKEEKTKDSKTKDSKAKEEKTKDSKKKTKEEKKKEQEEEQEREFQKEIVGQRKLGLYFQKQKKKEKKKNKIKIQDDFICVQPKVGNYQMDWGSLVQDDEDVLRAIDIGILMLQLELQNPGEKQDRHIISFIKREDLNVDISIYGETQPILTLIQKGIFIIEPIIRLSQSNGQFILYQTLGISCVHKSKKHQNNQKRSRDKNNYDLLIPENILSPRRRRELRILMCFHSRNKKGVDKNPVYCNGNRVNKGSQFFDKSKDLDRDKKKFIKFFLWPNYRLEDLACMNRYWFDTNNGSRFSILRIRMYPRLKR